MTIYNVIEQRIGDTENFTGTNGGSTGTIDTIAGSDLVVGERFFLKDGINPEVTYEFEDAAVDPALEETPTLRVIRFLVGDSADDVRDRIIAAVNRTSELHFYAGDGGAAKVGLTNATPGLFGNVTPTADTVANGGFVVSAMTGGVPPTPSVILDGVRTYEKADFGGIFEFYFVIKKRNGGKGGLGGVKAWQVDRVLLETTGATTYTLSILAPDGTSWTVSSGGGDSVLVTDPILLAGDERLRLVTTVGTAEMVARVMARPLIPLSP